MRIFLSTLLGFLISVNSAHFAHAEELGFWSALGRDVAAPIRRKDILISGTVISAATYPLVFTPFQANIANARPLGDTSKIGYQGGLWTTNVVYVAGLASYAWIADDAKSKSKVWLTVRASVYTGLLTQAIKSLQLEERPRNNNDFASFPSGHASNAFVMAGIIHRNHGWQWGVPAFAAAGFVGFSRMNDNAHYLHDVLFGATLGLSYAFGLDSEFGKPDEGNQSVRMIPLLGVGTLAGASGVSLQIKI